MEMKLELSEAELDRAVLDYVERKYDFCKNSLKVMGLQYIISEVRGEYKPIGVILELYENRDGVHSDGS